MSDCHRGIRDCGLIRDARVLGVADSAFAVFSVIADLFKIADVLKMNLVSQSAARLRERSSASAISEDPMYVQYIYTRVAIVPCSVQYRSDLYLLLYCTLDL